MSRETRIGLLFAVSLGVLVFGFKYLKGQNVLSSSYLFYVEYGNVDYLQASNPIMKNGFQIGTVKDIYMKPDDPTKIIVELDVDGSLSIPKDAKAVIVSTGLMGGKAIELQYNRNCNGDACADSGDYLDGVMKGMISSMIGDPSEVKNYMDVVTNSMSVLVDSLGEKVDTSSEIGKTFASLQATLKNLEITTARLDNLMARSSGSLESTLRSVASLTSNLEQNNAKITSIIGSTDEMIANLNKADLGKTVGSANDALVEVKKVMASSDEAVKKLSAVMDKANATDGTLGMLLTDKALYENLNQVSRSITLLTSDLREHPERYRRIFAKKTTTEPVREVPKEVLEGN